MKTCKLEMKLLLNFCFLNLKTGHIDSSTALSGLAKFVLVKGSNLEKKTISSFDTTMKHFFFKYCCNKE